MSLFLNSAPSQIVTNNEKNVKMHFISDEKISYFLNKKITSDKTILTKRLQKIS